MASADHLIPYLLFLILALVPTKSNGNDILGCGGFVKSHVALDYSKIEIGLYTKAGSLKERTECAPTNGYYFLPLYEKGDYVLKVHPPPGWSFEPSEAALHVDGITDSCSTGHDINFSFNGFGITGRVITAGQTQGPGGIGVQLVDDKGEKRDTITGVGGDFHFTPVIPGKYTLKASHPKWKLDPAQSVVQVKEGNTALPTGVLVVKGYDVKGTVISYGTPMENIYVLLYSKETNPKFRVEGCKTALLQGVPDAPICHAITDASGEFSFGLVPAGEYRLLALAKPPGQTTIRYDIKPDTVTFSVKHDSLFIKNAFEVTGFTVVGSVTASAGGAGIAGARVLKDKQPVGNTDAAGKFTLPSLQPGTYSLTFEHEQCEVEEVTVSVTSRGPRSLPSAVASRWRVCGAVSPPPDKISRRVALRGARGDPSVAVDASTGKWCTFLPPGTYDARVEVSDAEQREGLQFYPLTQKVTVSSAPVTGLSFSQLKASVSGRVVCSAAACEGLAVTLRPLSPDGGYVGTPATTRATKGEYKFTDVLPGSVEISVSSDRLCWSETAHNVAVASETATVPDFIHTGYVLRVHSSHDIEVEYSSPASSGSLSTAAGGSRQCVSSPARYTLTPRGPHRFQPPTAVVDTSAKDLPTVHFIAVSHACVVQILSPEGATDVVLQIRLPRATEELVPLKPQTRASGGFAYEHVLYLAEGEVATVSAQSSTLLFHPAAPQQIVGGRTHQPSALIIRARRGLTLGGRLQPAVEGVKITLTDGENTQTMTTTSNGEYSFGPLDASHHYTITAEKESYVFGEREQDGRITAHELANIVVTVLDDATGMPLQGALVSVSGGAYRRNAASDSSGRLRFPSLPPASYYVKPHLKEFRFSPPSHTIQVTDGQHHSLEHRGTRIAWSCVGRLVSAGGVGWLGAGLLATPTPTAGQPANCAPEEATTDAEGEFRIRGLLPGCVYSLQLKQSTTPETAGLRLTKPPPTLEIKNKRDITGILLLASAPAALTDASVIIRSLPDHYRTLRLTLATQTSPHSPVWSSRLENSGNIKSGGILLTLPRLTADNQTYILQLHTTLSRTTHDYSEEMHYFTSDGRFKDFVIEFNPKVKSTEQELRATSLLVVPFLLLLALGWAKRDALLSRVIEAVGALGGSRGALGGSRGPVGGAPRPRHDLLDKASIDHILNAVNSAGKKTAKKKQ